MARVLGIVSFRVYPTHMGGQKGVALFYENLQKFMEVSLVVSEDNIPTDKVQLIRSLHPNRKMPFNIFRLNRLYTTARVEKADLVVAEHSYTGWLAWLVAKKLKRPFIIHSHNIESRRFQKMKKWWWKIYAAYEKFIHRKAHHNFFISREDLDYAIGEFGISHRNSTVITYGTQEVMLNRNKAELKRKLSLDQYDQVFLFNGTLDYTPNYEAVLALINHLLPLLRKKLNNFLLVITGNRAPHHLATQMLATPNLLYAGYVDDVNEYYQAADFFINPVANDTGVKTKLIEAIANHCTTISTKEGASGIRTDLCGDKLIIVKGSSWEDFANSVVQALGRKYGDTPPSFFDYYSWEAIAGRAADAMQQTIDQFNPGENGN